MKVGTVLKIAAPGHVHSHAPHLRDDMITTLNVLMATADTFNSNLAATHADANLSPQGRTAAGMRVAAAALATLDAVEQTTIKELTARAALVERSLLAGVTYSSPKNPADRASDEARMQEIRNQLRELSAQERLTVFLTSSDPLTLAAIESAPMTLSAPRQDGTRKLESFIDPEQRAAAMMARAEAANPTAANTLREIRSEREVYTLALNGLRKEILDEVPEAQTTSTSAAHGPA